MFTYYTNTFEDRIKNRDKIKNRDILRDKDIKMFIKKYKLIFPIKYETFQKYIEIFKQKTIEVNNLYLLL